MENIPLVTRVSNISGGFLTGFLVPSFQYLFFFSKKKVKRSNDCWGWTPVVSHPLASAAAICFEKKTYNSRSFWCPSDSALWKLKISKRFECNNHTFMLIHYVSISQCINHILFISLHDVSGCLLISMDAVLPNFTKNPTFDESNISTIMNEISSIF